MNDTQITNLYEIAFRVLAKFEYAADQMAQYYQNLNNQSHPEMKSHVPND